MRKSIQIELLLVTKLKNKHLPSHLPAITSANQGTKTATNETCLISVSDLLLFVAGLAVIGGVPSHISTGTSWLEIVLPAALTWELFALVLTRMLFLQHQTVDSTHIQLLCVKINHLNDLNGCGFKYKPLSSSGWSTSEDVSVSPRILRDSAVLRKAERWACETFTSPTYINSISAIMWRASTSRINTIGCEQGLAYNY